MWAEGIVLVTLTCMGGGYSTWFVCVCVTTKLLFKLNYLQAASHKLGNLRQTVVLCKTGKRGSDSAKI